MLNYFAFRILLLLAAIAQVQAYTNTVPSIVAIELDLIQPPYPYFKVDPLYTYNTWIGPTDLILLPKYEVSFVYILLKLI
jgi:hypothetical protein